MISPSEGVDGDLDLREAIVSAVAFQATVKGQSGPKALAGALKVRSLSVSDSLNTAMKLGVLRSNRLDMPACTPRPLRRNYRARCMGLISGAST